MDGATYTPERIDAMLREWPRWVALAEGLGSSLPDTHRHGSGGLPDPMRAADQVADLERAIAACLRHQSLEWRAVRAMQQEGSTRRIRAELGARYLDVTRAYRGSLEAMAAYLSPTDHA